MEIYQKCASDRRVFRIGLTAGMQLRHRPGVFANCSKLKQLWHGQVSQDHFQESTFYVKQTPDLHLRPFFFATHKDQISNRGLDMNPQEANITNV
ncbi:hypothetical protein MPTK1_2g16040 [Marchantia polymorpha subsp. ruderalis]|uniref:Uncharacterized protein n=1 Tax=Marchantia polymorpha TaxID=3197 RepID=A0A2R6XMU0_MARPO|nr:hypothetical protein MARPO_0008s0191 [Marchantia polymorpha]BBN02527.1 hypothetical protein Mp_2g16040 [Marchantia polymorpha subsp. ruderalis]|eukprot:PTQ47440.1 hypothetical protein MARPO_0008s0191 [Marchantia polymorpha]